MAKQNSKQDLGALVAQASVQRPRERIVASAQDLFHRHGIRGIGVDAIAEAAGTNKMTLYRHFGSKDDLILEYLNYKGKKSDEIWAEIEAENPDDPAGQLYGFVAKVAKFIAEDQRGCDLAKAMADGDIGKHSVIAPLPGQTDRMDELRALNLDTRPVLLPLSRQIRQR